MVTRLPKYLLTIVLLVVPVQTELFRADAVLRGRVWNAEQLAVLEKGTVRSGERFQIRLSGPGRDGRNITSAEHLGTASEETTTHQEPKA